MATSNPLTNEEIKNRVRKIRVQFISNVDPAVLSDYLIQEDIISIEEKEQITNSNVTNSTRCRALLDHLFKIDHKKAFTVVQLALESQSQYKHILESMNNLSADEKSKQSCAREEQSTVEEVISLKHELEKERRTNKSLRDELVERCAISAFEEMTEKHKLRDAKLEVKQTRELKGIQPLSYPPQISIEVQRTKTTIVEIDYKSDPVLMKTIRTKSAEEEDKLISGMTILDEELFIVIRLSSVVDVYDSIEFSFSRRFELKELIHPQDIGSCNRNKCLYIMDGKYGGQSSGIVRVDPNGKLRNRWSTGKDWGRLSVTDESNLILTVYSENKLKEYSPDGQLIREVNLSSNKGLIHPMHAIKLTDGHFLVIHGDHDDRLHRVCFVDVDGKVKKSFGGEKGSTDEQFNLPVYLAVDGNGSILVADCGNSRVLLLDSNMEFKREIVSKGKHGLRYPLRICLDESNGRLLVADNEWDEEKKFFTDGRVLVFNAK